MAQTKNLCAQIPTALHERVCEAKEQSGLTTAQYITNLLLEYYEMKENGGKVTMANNNTRTMAFQIPEDLFQRIKAHLERETQRTGRKLTQREFVLGLVEAALDEAERQAAKDPEQAEQPSGGADTGPCEALPENGGIQPQDIPGEDDEERCEDEAGLPLGLVEAALDGTEQQAEEDIPEKEEQSGEGADTGPCESQPEDGGILPQDIPGEGGDEPCEDEAGLPESQDK